MSRSTSPRRQHTAPQKVAILRSHLLEGRPVSSVCDEHGINPTLFYRWQKELFERRGAEPAGQQAEKRIGTLERKLRQKDEVLGEVMAEHIAIRRTLGSV